MNTRYYGFTLIARPTRKMQIKPIAWNSFERTNGNQIHQVLIRWNITYATGCKGWDIPAFRVVSLNLSDLHLDYKIVLYTFT